MLSRTVAKALYAHQPMSWLEAILFSTMALAAAVPVAGGLYLAKSAAGINLMVGPSPLHDLLYHLVR